MSHESMDANRLTQALGDVVLERCRQHATHGEQTRANGIWDWDRRIVERLLISCRLKQAGPDGAPWGYLLLEEACEAALETDPARLRAELVQVAALAVQWVEALDREAGPGSGTAQANDGMNHCSAKAPSCLATAKTRGHVGADSHGGGFVAHRGA